MKGGLENYNQLGSTKLTFLATKFNIDLIIVHINRAKPSSYMSLAKGMWVDKLRLQPIVTDRLVT